MSSFELYRTADSRLPADDRHTGERRAKQSPPLQEPFLGFGKPTPFAVGPPKDIR